MEIMQFWTEADKWLHVFIGADAETIEWWQMCIRGFLIFVYGLLLVHIAEKRIFTNWTSFEIVLGVIVGSILSRALTANARFLPTLATATILVLLHKIMAKLSFSSRFISHLTKGKKIQLIREGKILWKNMKKSHVTEHDLREVLRIKTNIKDLRKVKAAYLERSGDISFIT